MKQKPYNTFYNLKSLIIFVKSKYYIILMRHLCKKDSQCKKVFVLRLLTTTGDKLVTVLVKRKLN